MRVFGYILIISFFCIQKNYSITRFDWRGYDSIQLTYDTSALRLPGESFKIGVKVYKKNGKIRETFGYMGGFMSWMRFRVEVAGGNFYLGKIHVNKELYQSKGKWVLIKVYPNRQPKLAKELLLPLHYEEKVELLPDHPYTKAPGFSFDFKIRATFNNGVQREYKSTWLRDEFDDYILTGYGGNIRRSTFHIENDFRFIKDHLIGIHLQSKRAPGVVFYYQDQLDYRANYKAHFSGWNGIDGSNGWDGSDGSSGTSGGNGGHGGHGGDGSRGPDLAVWADLYFDSLLHIPLLYVVIEVEGSGSEKHYLINPDGGNIKVVTQGGDGGDGGRGGDGGDGGDGRDGNWHERKEWETDSTYVIVKWQDPGSNGGNGGYGGDGGDGGYGGPGGDIFVYLTDDAALHEDLIVAKSYGGWSGSGGFGGSGGYGGEGGDGDPDGSDGAGGCSGSSGNSGSSGFSGEIYYYHTDDWVNYKQIANQKEPDN
jgi:uncharacterized membrane protein YgcG